MGRQGVGIDVQHAAFGIHTEAGNHRYVPPGEQVLDEAEFAASRRQKVRDPADDVVTTYRVLGVRVKRPRADDSGVSGALMSCTGAGWVP